MDFRGFLTAATFAFLGFTGGAARADTVSVDWFTVSPSNPDFGSAQCCSTFSNEVSATLGPNGMPVLNNANGFPLTEAVGSELQWWTPSATVTHTLSTTTTLLPNQNLFPPNGTGGNDANGFQTAIFRGTLTVGAGGGSIFFGGDDDVFLALNGSIVDQVDGVHQTTDTTFNVAAAGTYSLELFYADRDQVDANLQFQLTNATISAVPEPSTWAMMLIGFAGLAWLGHRASRTSGAKPT
jgi:fibro-slime domain-containing protein